MSSTTAMESTHETTGELLTPGSRWLAIALVLALTLQVITVTRSPLIAPDGFGFVQYARELAETPRAAIRAHAQHPGYPLLILGAHELTGRLISGDRSWMAAAQLASGLCGLACVLLVWLITRNVADPPTANVAAVLFALLPSVRQNAADALSDPPHLMLYLGAVWLVCEATGRRSLWRFLLAGAVSGAAFWVRPEGLAVALVAACGIGILPAWRTRFGIRQACAASGALLMGAALFVTPYVVISGHLTGKLAGKPGWWDQDVAAAVVEEVPPPSTVEYPQQQPAHAVPVIPLRGIPTPWDDPWPSALAAGVARFCTRLAENLNGILLLPLLIGIPLAARRMERTDFTLLTLLAVSQIGLMLLLYRLGGYIDRRHQFPLLAVLMPSIGMGALLIRERLSVRRFGPRGVVWLRSGLALCTLAILVPRAVRPLHPGHQHKLSAVSWLQEHCEPNDVIGSTSMEVVYFVSLDGQHLAGSVLNAGQPIDSDGPLLRNSFLVLELNEQNELPAWSTWIPPEFAPVMTIHGNARLRQRDMVIYQRREISESAQRIRNIQ